MPRTGDQRIDGRRLRIALISPKGPLYRHRGGIFKKSLRYKPLTLTTLAAYVPPELNAEIVCLDEGIGDIDADTLDADLVGFTTITGNAMRVYELSARLRARGITTVAGGPHVTLVPDDVQPHVDAICVGYAEDSWPQLLRDFVAGQLKPRYDQQPGMSLADRPFAQRDRLPLNRFLTDNVFEATRGCVHDCEFCVVPSAWGRKPYQKPIADVVADLTQHLARRTHRKVIFIDLNLIADRKHAADLFRALIPLKIQWYGLATVLIGHDDELLELAQASGCRGLLIGFESISPANLAQTKKGFNKPDDYANLVAKLHRHKIAVQGCFTFGMDDDDLDIFERTAKFAVEAAIDLPRFAVVTPFPGTRLFARLEAEGRILHRNWSLYDAQHVVFQPKRMSTDELQRGTERAWKIAYSWRSIASRLLRSPAPLHVRMLTNLGYRFYANNLSRFYNCDWILGPSPDQAVAPQTVPLTIAGVAR